ncbi:MAG: hypothetical protein MK008_13820 [Bdellovibrionales bacterium]|nr:hypothetical protein [Bdellovibrionales bacterium]
MQKGLLTVLLLALINIGCSNHRTSVETQVTGSELEEMLNTVVAGGATSQSGSGSVFKDEYATIFMSTSEDPSFGSPYSVLSFYNLSDLGFSATFDQLTNARVFLAELDLAGERRRAELAVAIQTQADGSFQTKRLSQVSEVEIKDNSWEVTVSDGQIQLTLVSYNLQFQSTQLDSFIKVDVYRDGQYIGKFPTLAGFFK